MYIPYRIKLFYQDVALRNYGIFYNSLIRVWKIILTNIKTFEILFQINHI